MFSKAARTEDFLPLPEKQNPVEISGFKIRTDTIDTA
jgi:hypothetical protein